eukprot:9453083-Alexandrium_andersonii.AAC.1
MCIRDRLSSIWRASGGGLGTSGGGRHESLSSSSSGQHSGSERSGSRGAVVEALRTGFRDARLPGRSPLSNLLTAS